jgi:hypothetical protein
VSITSGSASVKKPAAAHRRQLGRIAQHQHRLVEGQEVVAEVGIDHRALVDDDEVGLGCRAGAVEGEGRTALVALLAAVDQRMDRRRIVAALLAHHRGRLAGEGAVDDRAVDVVGDTAGERGLAGAGIAEQAEDLVAALLAPAGDGFQRRILLRGELGGNGVRHGRTAPQGQRTVGGSDDRIEATLPPVFRPKMVPRS